MAKLNSNIRHGKSPSYGNNFRSALLCTQLSARITWALSWIPYTEPITSVWMRKAPCAVQSHSITASGSAPGSCKISHSSSPIQIKLRLWERKKVSISQSTQTEWKAELACAEETLKLTNWNATEREKSGNNSLVIDPFKLIMKSCREATSSDNPTYS